MKFDFDTLQEDSPYPEFQASVSNIDNPDMLALTVWVSIVGLFFSLAGGYISSFLLSHFPSSLTVFGDCSSLNVFFNFRQPAPLVIPIVLLLIAHPLGKFLSYLLPTSSSAYALQEVSGPRFLSMS
jgi:hypothetical protein